MKEASEGFFQVNCGVEQGIDRGLSYAPYADLIWMETSNPDLEYARKFAEGIHAKFPGKMLAYNCSPSFNWAAKLTVPEMETFREELAENGIQIPIYHFGRIPRFEYCDVRIGIGLQRKRNGGLQRITRKRICITSERFPCSKTPKFRGNRLF